MSSPGSGLQASTKFAVEGFTGALRAVLVPLGITAGLVEPGFFRADFLNASSFHVSRKIPDHADISAGATHAFAAQANHNQPGDPAKGATLLVDSDDFPLLLFLGRDTHCGRGRKLAAVHAGWAGCCPRPTARSSPSRTWRTCSRHADRGGARSSRGPADLVAQLPRPVAACSSPMWS
ncbi:hypothetical protein BC739_004037 [Kutzneria viridogrisea]|uniref:Uncharacterized protein n=1 Tax=Kutzneria viridogrisea TaxID=47990 RepID=A0ABR6BIY5_9PSEU|nr:hypothetical protein [Kutzneria viridogrisea]